MRLISRLSFLALALSLAGAPVAAQYPGAESPAASAPAQTVEPSPSEPVLISGLPERAAPPRTLRAHWHVFMAFALAWVLLFGYVVSVGRRFARVEGDLRRLGGA